MLNVSKRGSISPASVEVRKENVIILVEYTLYCPGTNAAIERVFSVGNDLWTNEKLRLNVDTLAGALTRKLIELRKPSGQGFRLWQACHEFEPSTTKDPTNRGAMHNPIKNSHDPAVSVTKNKTPHRDLHYDHSNALEDVG
ncbi:hypothetical protein TNCV_3152471 [Trichonephila clavipes]|nr:hypothetical protein TNCV_3152471 [Trichonephila clavipes]